MKTSLLSKKALFALLAAFCLAAALSCASVAEAASLAAQAAGEAGVLDRQVADSVTASAGAWSRAAEDIEPEQEYYIGRAVGANILSRYRIYTASPARTAYINRILQAIVVNSPNPEIYNGYHAVILDSQEINAFATSGGHVFVTLGLVNTAASEDALAAVLAHEAAHIQLKHSIKAIKTSRITQALIATGSTAATVAAQRTNLADLTGIFDESITDIVSTLVNNGYSSEQEFEADALALRLLAGAGYDPAGLLEMLRALDANLGPRSGGFGKTHPAPRDRITSANRTLASVPRPTDTRAARTGRFTSTR
ncbi:MAG: M48 family metalloprotease [Spirochaetaceae bacterium]|jgi:predicted Zn-dependent protease|nr:M48 family metalloprotease [Spirochaetaceae bacterium]